MKTLDSGAGEGVPPLNQFGIVSFSDSVRMDTKMIWRYVQRKLRRICGDTPPSDESESLSLRAGHAPSCDDRE